MDLTIYKISTPEYQIKTMPEYKDIGGKIDAVLKKHFLGQRLAVRCVSSGEHRGKTMDDLIKIIKKHGTDRYSPKRQGLKYKNVGNKHIDFFALDRKITPNAKIMWQFIWSFYYYPRQWGIKPTKIDLIILYNRKQLKSVRYTEDGRRYKNDGFIFKHPSNKPSALKGFINIL